MKKMLLILLVMIVSLHADIFKMSIPLDIDSLGNNKIIYENQSYSITKIKVVGYFNHTGGHYYFALGNKIIPLTSSGIHETVVFEKSLAELSEAQMNHSAFVAYIAFCTDNNVCFKKNGSTANGYKNMNNTNFDTFADIQNLRSAVSVVKK